MSQEDPPVSAIGTRFGQELMTLREVARYADVLPSAVSNWKRRHEDFPSPVEVTSSGTLYLAAQMFDWLERHGRITQGTDDAEDHATWDALAATTIRQMLRETSTGQVRTIILSVLLHAAISRGPMLSWVGSDRQQRRIPLRIPADASAPRLIERSSESADGAEFFAALEDAWRRCEEENPELSGLLLRAAPQEVQPGLIVSLLEAFDMIASEGQGRDLDPLHRVLWDEIAPFESPERGEMTPAGLSRLLVPLAKGRGPNFLDLAAGSGHLVFDAIIERWRPESPEGLLGLDVGGTSSPDPETVDAHEYFVAMNAETHAELVDPDAEALTEARIWSLIYDVPVTLTQGRLGGERLAVSAPVDSLLVDAPAGVRPRSPSERSSDWLDENAAGDLEIGFLVAARELLDAGGRAAIAISTRVATLRSTRIVEARGDLINGGHVEAVIALPGNLHHGLSRPISIIVMRGTPRIGPLLLIDATSCGRQRRRHRELSEVEAASIVALVEDWRAGRPILEPENVRAVTVDPVDLEDNVLDASIYLPLPEMPDADAIQAHVGRIQHELADVTGRLASTLAQLLEEDR